MQQHCTRTRTTAADTDSELAAAASARLMNVGDRRHFVLHHARLGVSAVSVGLAASAVKSRRRIWRRTYIVSADATCSVRLWKRSSLVSRCKISYHRPTRTAGPTIHFGRKTPHSSADPFAIQPALLALSRSPVPHAPRLDAPVPIVRPFHSPASCPAGLKRRARISGCAWA